MKKFILGYIVSGKGGAYVLGAYKPDEKKILLYGKQATIFENRESAINAIARTKTYAKRNAMKWDTAYFIQPIISENHP